MPDQAGHDRRGVGEKCGALWGCGDFGVVVECGYGGKLAKRERIPALTRI